MNNTNNIIKLIVIIHALSLVVGCGNNEQTNERQNTAMSSDDVVSPEPKTNHGAVAKTASYSEAFRPRKEIDPLLAKIADGFFVEAARRNIKTVDMEALATMVFANEDRVKERVLGYCITQDLDSGRDWIEIAIMPLQTRFGKSSVEELTKDEYLSLVQTVYHELAHCFLLLAHSKSTAVPPPGFTDKVMATGHTLTTNFSSSANGYLNTIARNGASSYAIGDDLSFDAILKTLGLFEARESIQTKITERENSLLNMTWQKWVEVGGSPISVVINETNLREVTTSFVYGLIYKEALGEKTADELSEAGFNIIINDLFDDAINPDTPRLAKF